MLRQRVFQSVQGVLKGSYGLCGLQCTGCQAWSQNYLGAIPSSVDQITLLNTNSTGRSIGTSATSPNRLDQIVKIAKLESEDTATIKDIWKTFHSDPKMQQAGYHLSEDEFTTLQSRMLESPIMAIPIKKPQELGGEMDDAFVSVVAQAQLPQHLLITTVDEFRAKGLDAASAFIVTFYPELAKSKDVVLARGDILTPSLLGWQEATELLPAICRLYVDDEQYKLVHAFNHDQAKFDFNKVLELFGIQVPKAF